MPGEVLKRMDSAGGALQPQGSNTGAGVGTGAGTGVAPGAENAAQAAQISQDDWDLLNARVEEQRQTKVESGSKFRLKLSGIALFNAFDNTGNVDNLDLPAIAVPKRAGFPEGGLGASLRQSIIGLTEDRKSTRLNSSHANISYAVFCLKKKKKTRTKTAVSIVATS